MQPEESVCVEACAMVSGMKRKASSGRAGIHFYRIIVDQHARLKRRRPRKDEEPGGVPVEPNRPNTLSGGAAAALEFDD